MINYTLCSIKVYFRFIKDTLGLVQVVSSVVQVLSIILLVISSVVLTASRILQVVSTANKVHLSDFIEHTLHERFAPLHSCKNPPHQTPAPLCSHGRGLIIDHGGMTRAQATGKAPHPAHPLGCTACTTHSTGWFRTRYTVANEALPALLHWFAQARSPGRFRPYTVCALICTSSLTWGDFGPLHSLRTKGSPRSIARGIGLRTLPSPRARYTTYGVRRGTLRTPIFYACRPASGRVGPTHSGRLERLVRRA